jgi:hypothetical protein
MYREQVKVNENVKVVEYPDNSKLIVVFTPEGYYENAIYIDPDKRVASGRELICHTKDQKLIPDIQSQSKCFQIELEHPAAKAVESVSPNSVTVLKVGSYCNVIPGAHGPIYICIPPGTPC